MVDAAARNVRWTGVTKGLRKTSKYVKNPRKRYATRDQPTWKNCKLLRPSRTKRTETSDGTPGISETKEYTGEGDKVLPSRRTVTPKSSRLFSAKSSLSKVTNSSTSTSTAKCSGESLQSLESLRRRTTSNNSSKTGRHILMEKTKEITPGFDTESWNTRNKDAAFKPQDQALDAYHSLRKFRLSSAESTHKSPDVSIGLRQISRMLALPSKKLGERQQYKTRSYLTLEALVTITTQNMQARRKSEPIVQVRSDPTSTPNDIWKELGPGEGDTRHRRRSSTTSATKGEGSIPPNHPGETKNKSSRPRPLPAAYTSAPYSCREWRPPTLHKYSVKQPWAPQQQSSRYFPRYANLQDVHCRNPYTVPGSVLYKPLPGDPR